MEPELYRLLDIDPNDPTVVAAAQDVDAYAGLIESLVALRHQRGLTLRDVAKHMETTQSAVADFERIGGDARCSTAQRYARAVGARLHLAVDQPTPGYSP